MTVSALVTRNDITATASQTSFTYTFRVLEATDMAVYQNGALLASGYTVNDVGVTTGGTVTLDVGVPVGQIVSLVLAMPLDRTTNYQNSGKFLADDVNEDFDKIYIGAIQNENEGGRSLRLQDVEPTIAMTLPLKADRLGKYLAFDASTGLPIATAGTGTTGDSSLVTYLPAGTGAVSTSVQAKLRESVSVMDFGAMGDGVTDDTNAFNAALTASASVLVPEGSFKITSTVIIPAYHGIVGSGQGSIIICEQPSGDFAFKLGDSAVALNYGCFLTDLRFTITLSNRKSILAYGTSGAVVKNIFINSEVNIGTTGLVVDGGNQSSFFNIFENINALHCNLGFHITTTGTSYPTEQLFIGCSAFGDYNYGDTTSVGIWFEVVATNPCGVTSTVLGGNFESCSVGVFCDSSQINFHGLRFEQGSPWNNLVDVKLGTFTSDVTFIACRGIDTGVRFPNNATGGYGRNTVLGCTGTLGIINQSEGRSITRPPFAAIASEQYAIKIINSSTQTESPFLMTNSSGTVLMELTKEGGYTSYDQPFYSGSSVAISSSAKTAFKMSSTANFGITYGSGAPTHSAAQGSLYMRSDGTTTNDRMYANTNGTTGWTSLVTSA